jgi:DNA-binding SARP family transcriptional activator/TolB-like protein
MNVKLITLGELTLRRVDGDQIADSMRKPLLVLAVLAAEAPAAVSRERLIQLLWPKSPIERGRQALNQTLYSLRRELSPSVIVGTGQISLGQAVRSDIADLRRAIAERDADTSFALSSRLFLDGIGIPDGVEFDHWVDAVRRELDRSVTVLLRSVAKQVPADDPTMRVMRWQQYGERCVSDPLVVREAASQMAAAGNRAAAAHLLQRHAEVLAGDLELAIDAETSELLASLRDAGSRREAELAHASLPERELNRQRVGDQLFDGADGAASSLDLSRERVQPVSNQPGRRVSWMFTAIATFALLFLGVMAQRPAGPVAANSKLLVAPFRVGGDTVFDYLGTGIAEEIASRLAGIPQLTLYPPSLALGAQRTTAFAQANRLGADYLLEGTIRTERRNGRIMTRSVSWLVSTSTGEVLWTWSADRELNGMLGLQREIADSTARRLSLLMSAAVHQQVTSLPTTDPTAYDLYLRSLQYLHAGRDGLPEARELLRQAVALDSGFALALARLGETQARMNWYGYDRDVGRMREARRLIDRSHRLAPRHAEPHIASAHWWLANSRAYASAAAELDTALGLAPANVDALTTRANISRRMGRWEASVEDYAEAGRLDATAYAVHLEHGNTLLLMRRFTEARGALERARLLSPDAVDPVVWLAALEVREDGDTLKAQRMLQEALGRVNAHALVARVSQSFPELVRLLPSSARINISEFSLRDAYGDTALLQILRADAGRPSGERQAHLDSAAAILLRRLAVEPSAFAAFRALARVRLAQGRSEDAVRAAQRSLELMPQSLDAHAAMQALSLLAEAEIAAGRVDSARAHVGQLLRQPSVLTTAILAIDPAWRAIGRISK